MNYKEYTVRVYENGAKEWRQNGLLHREDGPACEFTNGDKFWYRNGKHHREDGPAIECVNGTKRWYLEGIEYSEENFQKKMNPQQLCCEKIVEIDGKKYKLMEV